jgi:hypothetical protein
MTPPPASEPGRWLQHSIENIEDGRLVEPAEPARDKATGGHKQKRAAMDPHSWKAPPKGTDTRAGAPEDEEP